MKKFAAFLLILPLGLFTIGCGGETPPAEPPTPPAEETETETETGLESPIPEIPETPETPES
jgi:hypothetical protein